MRRLVTIPHESLRDTSGFGCSSTLASVGYLTTSQNISGVPSPGLLARLCRFTSGPVSGLESRLKFRGGGHLLALTPAERVGVIVSRNVLTSAIVEIMIPDRPERYRVQV